MPTLATAVVAFLSIAVQADNSLSQLERDRHINTVTASNVETIEQLVPDKSVLIFREDGYLHHLQFVRNYATYLGMTFDRNWVNGRKVVAADDADPHDPARAKQLQEALKGHDQNSLNSLARATVQNALVANRRVLVVEQAKLDDLIKARKEQKDGPIPEFVRRFILPGKDKSLAARRVAYWNVPIVVKDPPKPGPRGRREARPAWRSSCYQVWEITLARP